VAGRARQGGDLNYASPNPVLTAEEDGVGLGDDDEGEGDEEEADDDDQQPEPPGLLPEAPHQLRPLPGLHPAPFSTCWTKPKRKRGEQELEEREPGSRKGNGAQVAARSGQATWPGLLRVPPRYLCAVPLTREEARRGGAGWVADCSSGE